MHSSILSHNLKQSIQAKQQLLEATDQHAVFDQFCNLILERYDQGGRLYIAGNGGSAGDAQHMAAEIVCRLTQDRNPLPAEALTVDSSVITAIANDYSYEQVFSRQLAGKATKRDLFLGITTSGNSPNIIAALIEARKLEIPALVLTGHQGGIIARDQLADLMLIATGRLTQTIQEVHLVMIHSICEVIETHLLKKSE